MTAAFQFMSLIMEILPMSFMHWWFVLPDAALVVGVAVWAVLASSRNNIRQMSYSAFVLFLFWLFTGLLRLIVVEGVGQFLWAPHLIIAAIMATVFLYLSNQRRMSDLD